MHYMRYDLHIEAPMYTFPIIIVWIFLPTAMHMPAIPVMGFGEVQQQWEDEKALLELVSLQAACH